AGVGLWWPVVLAVVFGIVPAALAWRSRPTAPDPVELPRPERGYSAPSPVQNVTQRVLATGAKVLGARGMDLRVEGAESLPSSGPVLVAARHFHHLNDGCAIVATAGRPVHILVALDWVKGRFGRSMMERACGMARWPFVLRDDALVGESAGSAFRASESRQYLRRAVGESVDLLRAGELLVVFPEAYPNIDPAYTPKRDDTTFLPFRPGFVRLVELAERDGQTRVPIVPVGFAYEPSPGKRWQVVMRIGAPVWLDGVTDRARVVRSIEDQVRTLSVPAEPVGVTVPREAVSS
ncbi:MAG: 1-acyl-sn-glycerol-3-phosphate acyltransferase, partial [Chloroflexota bacterium]|nr:1-acyl-sn-glycerol-3-phosphate acyltransferase [Chloroflexota bacterium]